jgi:predicted transcriptional regulator
MAKDRESITIDKDVNKRIKKEAEKQMRSYSSMIEFACNQYLILIEKKKES